MGFTNCVKSTPEEKEQTKQKQTVVEQTASDHLTFKGVPIDGSLDEYVSKMKAAGFSYIGTAGEDGTAVLKGDFAGVKGCMIVVSTLQNSDIVNTINVVFPEKDDWSYLEADYQQLKTMLTEKYGEPSECVEKFDGPSYSETNIDKLFSLRMDKCTYATVYKTAKGDIKLSLEHSGPVSCFVKLQYWDKINTETVRAKAMDDL